MDHRPRGQTLQGLLHGRMIGKIERIDINADGVGPQQAAKLGS